MTGERESESALERHLSSNGVRVTAQRRLLLRLIERARRPVSAPDLLNLARREMGRINRATIYRTIALLKEHHLVDELDLLHHEGGGHYYETVPTRQELHLVCLRCGRVVEMTTPHWERMKDDAQARHGFQVTTARLEMGGLCARCRR